MTEPLDLAPIEDRDAHAECVAICHQPQADRRALLAEVKRLRAHLDDDRISRSEYAERTGFCPDCGQPIQPGIA